MLKDMKQQKSLYRPTAFWERASKILIEEFNRNGFVDFRAGGAK